MRTLFNLNWIIALLLEKTFFLIFEIVSIFFFKIKFNKKNTWKRTSRYIGTFESIFLNSPYLRSLILSCHFNLIDLIFSSLKIVVIFFNDS